MAYTTINKHTDYFNTVLYTGDGNATQAITNTFQTDFSWIKDRGVTAAHTLQDAVRGFDVTKKLSSNSNDAENNSSGATWGNYGGVTAVGATSFTTSLGSNTPYQTNANGSNYVAWNWKAGGGQGSSNTDGSINTTYTSVNTTAGFSISLYTGSGSAATVGHGLGAAPEIVIIKCTTHTENWVMYNKSLGAGKYIFPNTTAGAGPGSGTNTSYFNNTAPTNSVFSVGNDGGTNSSGRTYVAYCFKEKNGYSKFGSYKGNGNVDGTFVYTGFKPSLVILKRSSADGNNWIMYDNKRDVDNVVHNRLHVDVNNVEVTTSSSTVNNIDFLSNGIRLKNTGAAWNNNSDEYIYLAFGQSLVGSNNIPVTAR